MINSCLIDISLSRVIFIDIVIAILHSLIDTTIMIVTSLDYLSRTLSQIRIMLVYSEKWNEKLSIVVVVACDWVMQSLLIQPLWKCSIIHSNRIELTTRDSFTISKTKAHSK